MVGSVNFRRRKKHDIRKEKVKVKSMSENMNGWGATKHGISRSGYLNVTSHWQAGRGLT